MTSLLTRPLTFLFTHVHHRNRSLKASLSSVDGVLAIMLGLLNWVQTRNWDWVWISVLRCRAQSASYADEKKIIGSACSGRVVRKKRCSSDVGHQRHQRWPKCKVLSGLLLLAFVKIFYTIAPLALSPVLLNYHTSNILHYS